MSTGTCASPPTGATTYAFDGNGNLASSANPTSTFTYNTGANQTTAITDNTVTLSAMAYADVGQTERTSLTQGANTTSLLSTPLGVDKSTTGSASAYVVRDPHGNLVGYLDASGTHWYYLLDGHGSVVAVINNSGSTVGNRYAYDEYGRSVFAYGTPTVAQPWGYTAGYTDPTGLTKFGTRYYDPNLGRWTQPDPVAGTLASPQTVDRYLYASDNPIDNTDPTGMCGFFSCIGNAISSVANTVGCVVSELNPIPGTDAGGGTLVGAGAAASGVGSSALAAASGGVGIAATATAATGIGLIAIGAGLVGFGAYEIAQTC